MRPMQLLRQVIAFALPPCLLAALPVVSGCATRTANQDPPPLFEMPTAYSTSSPLAATPGGAWWAVFDDVKLNELMEEGFRGNMTLAQGMARIDQGRALFRQAKALGKPTADLEGSFERQRERDLDPPEPAAPTLEDVTAVLSDLNDLLAGEAPGGGGNVPGPGFDADTYSQELGSAVGVRWEVDLWGRLRALTAAEREELSALVQEYAALRLVLSAELAEAYYQAVEQRLQFRLLQDQRALADTYLQLLELRFLQGDASALDVLQQRGQLAEIDSEVPVVQSQLGILENRLDVLLGLPPDGADRTSIEGTTLPDSARVPATGVPADLLQRRPDLLALQRRVVANDYRIAAAMADRLPRVVLDGSLAYQNASGSASLTATGGAGLLQPLLDWGLRKAAVAQERARFEEALLEYSQGYLLAIEEVENALWREARQRDLILALERQLDLLERTVEEARMRYSLGATDYLPVLTALESLQNVQRSLLQERRTLVSLRITLHLATGGATVRPTDQSEPMAANEARAN